MSKYSSFNSHHLWDDNENHFGNLSSLLETDIVYSQRSIVYSKHSYI